MKLPLKSLIVGTFIVLTGAVSLLGFPGSAGAACWQYDPNGFTTSTTPVFNNICNVPEGIGNESDFVRIRQSSNGNDEDNQNNPNFTVGTLTAACNVGDKFDLWTYIHNDASQDFNNNGSGSAVAKDVRLAVDNSVFGKQGSTFPFKETISASNAASVTDTATLDCGSKTVELSLVPNTVHVYSSQYGWVDENDNTITGGNLPIGSPTANSGTMWGCWNYRVLVVYQVTVKEVPKTPVLQCSITDFTFDNETRKANLKLNVSAQNATVSSYSYDVNWGDNSAHSTGTSSSNSFSASHTYSADLTEDQNITSAIKATLSGGNTVTVNPDNCAETVSFTSTPPTTPPQTPPSVLPNTGAGSVLGIFAAATAAGAAGYRWVLARRLAKQ